MTTLLESAKLNFQVGETAQVPLDAICIDHDILSRVKLDQPTAEAYKKDFMEGVIYEDIDLFWDKTSQTLYLADGLHRVTAARLANKTSINAKIHGGGKREALLFSISHRRYGLARTNKDKRKSVLLLLADSEWAIWNNIKIAEQCSVTEGLVRIIKGELLKLESYSTRSSYAQDYGLSPKVIDEALKNIIAVNKSGICQIIQKGQIRQIKKPSRKGEAISKPTVIQIDPNIPPLVIGQPEEKGSSTAIQIRAIQKAPTYPVDIKVTKAKIWRLGQSHLIYCGWPTDSLFKNILPDDIKLAMAFPRQNTLETAIFPQHTPARFSFCCVPERLDIESFRQAVEHLVDASTEADDKIYMAFLPDPWLFLLFLSMSNPCYCAEPDPEICEQAVRMWNAFAAEQGYSPATELELH